MTFARHCRAWQSSTWQLINRKTATIELCQKEFVVISIEYFVFDSPTGTDNN